MYWWVCLIAWTVKCYIKKDGHDDDWLIKRQTAFQKCHTDALQSTIMQGCKVQLIVMQFYDDDDDDEFWHSMILVIVHDR